MYVSIGKILLKYIWKIFHGHNVYSITRFKSDTIDSQYIIVQCSMILHAEQQLQIWSFGQTLNSWNPLISP